jgi:hypothetical protein
LLHFEAVDSAFFAWVNGVLIGYRYEKTKCIELFSLYSILFCNIEYKTIYEANTVVNWFLVHFIAANGSNEACYVYNCLNI